MAGKGGPRKPPNPMFAGAGGGSPSWMSQMAAQGGGLGQAPQGGLLMGGQFTPWGGNQQFSANGPQGFGTTGGFNGFSPFPMGGGMAAPASGGGRGYAAGPFARNTQWDAPLQFNKSLDQVTQTWLDGKPGLPPAYAAQQREKQQNIVNAMRLQAGTGDQAAFAQMMGPGWKTQWSKMTGTPLTQLVGK